MKSFLTSLEGCKHPHTRLSVRSCATVCVSCAMNSDMASIGTRYEKVPHFNKMKFVQNKNGWNPYETTIGAEPAHKLLKSNEEW